MAEKVEKNVRNGSITLFNSNMKNHQAFDTVPISSEKKPKVGVVGEILVKYSPTANNDIVRLLEAEGAEAVVPDIIGFMNYSLYNQIWKYEQLGMSKQSKMLAQFAIKMIEWIENQWIKHCANLNVLTESNRSMTWRKTLARSFQSGTIQVKGGS